MINYYGPNGETDWVNVLKQLAIHLRNINADRNITCILGGDGNLIFDESLDAMGGSRSLKYNSLKELQTIISDYNLIDIWRVRNPNLGQCTWHRANPLMMRRLDFLISDDMQYDVKFCKNLTTIQSDHAPILLHVSSMKEERSRNRGYWKFNNSLTEGDHFVEL